MQEFSGSYPKSIEDSLGKWDERSLWTLAAFMLAAGFRSGDGTADHDLVPEEDLERLGLLDWWRQRFELRDLPSVSHLHNRWKLESLSREAFYERLADLIRQAISQGGLENTRFAVAAGLQCPDDLVRVCALHSASRIFRISPARMLQRLVWFHGRRDLKTVTRELVSMLLNRVTVDNQPPRSGYPHVVPMQTAGTKGLMLIHGTSFHWSRPVWSVPNAGPLYKHIKARRPDIYGHSDFFRWEGGYSEYAREVAAHSLVDWIKRRRLDGIDAVTHSHGGNVLIEATNRGAAFSKVIFLSCPVHWTVYRPALASIGTAHSIRIRFDFVILADGGHQRFPLTSGISEEVLPIWFTGHGATCEPKVWRAQSLDRFL